ncbi:MAG: GTP cyclohydrolase II [Austwickia sp.]|nr:GTP cyclohydrolase II [Austwickia sp.]MBK8437246.1 GTP cyclohydrolase II [Austwickia sp.]MBK9102479.1 GTP cyclohydrolase II [Austwickia sp.]
MDVDDRLARRHGHPDDPNAPSPLEPPHVIWREVETVLPTRWGVFRMIGYRGGDGTAHIALVKGLRIPPEPGVAPLVRVHSECLTGDALGSYRCDCGEQLQAGLSAIAHEGSGVLVYVRGHEGRGIGLLEKLRAYQLQDGGVDTLDANLQLGHSGDVRRYDQSADILADLGVRRVRLLSSNPDKERALRSYGIDVVERISLVMPSRPENDEYLQTKRDRMGHDRPELAHVWSLLASGDVPSVARGTEGAELVQRYGPLVQAGSPLVIAQLGQSLDGFIASRTGDADFVTGPTDHEHLHRLRALVDAVLVGVGTVVADDPRLTVRRVEGIHPARVILDPRGRAPRDSAVLTHPVAPTLWLVGPSAQVPPSEELGGHVEVIRLPGDGDADPAAVVAMLRERGLGRLLVEGGGQVVSSFLAARVVDRLYLTTAPMLIGDGIPGVRFDGSDALAGAVTGRSRRWLLGDDVCTELVFGSDG